MNHYERLKVSPEAPLEVIRAAYRALAAKHHPDRHTQPESAHGDMVALNAAYEVLADPVTRAAYDASLAQAGAPEGPATEPPDAGASRLQNLWRSTMGFGARDTVPPSLSAQDEPDESRVDVRWQPPLPAGVVNPWVSRKRMGALLIVLGAVTFVAGVVWVRAALQQMEAEQTLSQHYDEQEKASGKTAKAASPTRRRGTEMSDAELLADPPSLSSASSTAAVTLHGSHVLDGAPLSLREETRLADPLGLPPAHP